MVEYLPRMCEAVGSIFSTTTKKSVELENIPGFLKKKMVLRFVKAYKQKVAQNLYSMNAAPKNQCLRKIRDTILHYILHLSLNCCYKNVPAKTFFILLLWSLKEVLL